MIDRAAQLGQMADAYMANRAHPGTGPPVPPMPAGATAITVSLWPAEQPAEIRFAADWPGLTIVTKRRLA
jgi:hypothetical protein